VHFWRGLQKRITELYFLIIHSSICFHHINYKIWYKDSATHSLYRGYTVMCEFTCCRASVCYYRCLVSDLDVTGCSDPFTLPCRFFGIVAEDRSTGNRYILSATTAFVLVISFLILLRYFCYCVDICKRKLHTIRLTCSFFSLLVLQLRFMYFLMENSASWEVEPAKISCAILISSMRATCPAHLTFLDLYIKIIYGEE
jgi:hypothetical protein